MSINKKNITIPASVFNSNAYKQASPYAKNLLIEFAAQLACTKNGELIATWSHLKETGRWNSPITAFKARKELVQLKLIRKTELKGIHRSQMFALPSIWLKVASE